MVHAICGRAHLADIRDLLDEVLFRASYPSREIEVPPESDSQVELAAKLVPTTADPDGLDQVAAELDQSPLVRAATAARTRLSVSGPQAIVKRLHKRVIAE